MQESTANWLNFTTLSCMYYISTYYSVYHMCVIFCAVLNKIHSFIVSSILITGEANRIAGGPTEPVSGELRPPSEGVPVCVVKTYPSIDPIAAPRSN